MNNLSVTESKFNRIFTIKNLTIALVNNKILFGTTTFFKFDSINQFKYVLKRNSLSEKIMDHIKFDNNLAFIDNVYDFYLLSNMQIIFITLDFEIFALDLSYQINNDFLFGEVTLYKDIYIDTNLEFCYSDTYTHPTNKIQISYGEKFTPVSIDTQSLASIICINSIVNNQPIKNYFISASALSSSSVLLNRSNNKNTKVFKTLAYVKSDNDTYINRLSQTTAPNLFIYNSNVVFSNTFLDGLKKSDTFPVPKYLEYTSIKIVNKPSFLVSVINIHIDDNSVPVIFNSKTNIKTGDLYLYDSELDEELEYPISMQFNAKYVNSIYNYSKSDNVKFSLSFIGCDGITYFVGLYPDNFKILEIEVKRLLNI